MDGTTYRTGLADPSDAALAEAAEHKGDALAPARGLLLALVLGAGLWLGVFELLRVLL